MQKRSRWHRGRKIVLLLVAVLLSCGLLTTGGSALLDIGGVVQRLQVTPIVKGGDIDGRELVWGERLMPWFEPTAILDMNIEMQNRDSQALERVSAEIIVHDGLGRTAHSAMFRYGVASPGPRVLLCPGDIRPLQAASIIPPMPQTWTRAEIVLTFKLAEPETLRDVIRWHDFAIQSAVMQPDGSYDLVGSSPTAAPRAGGIDAEPSVMISFYNAKGEFVRGEAWYRADNINITIKANEMPHGPITQARVFYTEAFGPPLNP